MTRKVLDKKLIIEQLKKIPLIKSACEKVGVSRSTFYNWRNDDEKFSQEVDESIIEGEQNLNEMTENQLLVLIKEKNFPAMRFWLDRRHPKFRSKVDIDATIKNKDDKLTPEQEKELEEALKLTYSIENNIQKHE